MFLQTSRVHADANVVTEARKLVVVVFLSLPPATPLPPLRLLLLLLLLLLLVLLRLLLLLLLFFLFLLLSETSKDAVALGAHPTLQPLRCKMSGLNI